MIDLLTEILKHETALLSLIVFSSLGIAGVLRYLSRDITYFGTDTDNEKQAAAAASWRQWRWPSDMHTFGQSKTLMKDIVVLFLALSQRVCGEEKSDRPLVFLCFFCNAISAILVFLISKALWGTSVGAVMFFMYSSTFWPHQVALFGGHICVAQMLILLSSYAAIIAQGVSFPYALFCYGFSGACSAGTFFASSSARKYIPLSLFVLGWSVIGLPAFQGDASTIRTILLVVANIVGVTIVCYGIFFSYLKNRAGAKSRFLWSRLPERQSPQFFESFVKHYRYGGVALGVVLCTTLGLYAFTSASFISVLAFFVSFFFVFFALLYPNIAENISRYFYYWNIPKSAGHFLLYRDHFARIGKPIPADMRGAGTSWLIRFFAQFVPVHSVLVLVALVALALAMTQASPLAIFQSLVVLVICVSPLAWAELTGAPQLARSYIPVIAGILLLLGYTNQMLLQYAPSLSESYVSLLWIGAVLSSGWSLWVFFNDVFPARMAPAWAARKLKSLGAKKFYTYKTNYNCGFVDCMPEQLLKECERVNITSLKEVSEGYIVIPGTSSKALNMESEHCAIQYGDYTLDLNLNYLIESGKIESLAVCSFKTFGTSKIWVHESEASSHRAFITAEIGKKDLWRGHAWILDAAKVKNYLQGKIMNDNPTISKEALVSILVPSLNRSPFLIRLMRYYRSVDFKGCLCIADSSTPEDFAKTAAEVAAHKGHLNIIHLSMPGKHAGKCLKEMVDFCSTPYVAFIGDDDFFIPSGLVRCIEFLEKHPDYAAAHGESLSVTLDQSGAYGNPIAAVHYPQPVLEHTDPTQRIAQLMSGYGVTLFSVHRIETWRSMFQDTDKVTDKAFREELLPCLMTVILGKVAALNDLYLVRQHHDQRYALPTTFEWVGKPDWSASYHKTCESLARELGMRTNLPFNDALQVLQQCFSIYISLALARESLKVAINTPFDPKVKPWDIQALLNPQGEFYQQFLPVGQAMKGH